MSETKRRAKYTLEFKMEEVCPVRQECNDPLRKVLDRISLFYSIDDLPSW